MMMKKWKRCHFKGAERMKSEIRKLFFNEFISMYESLNEAVYEAGGCAFSLAKLNEMTAAELMEELATNHIRFTFVKPKEEEDE